MSLLVTPRIESAVSRGTNGRFTIEPLEVGFGITLGNALRRVLLSSLPGAAVTWVRIEGVLHEFSTIPHVKEDTTEFLLNVKGIRLQALSDRAGSMYLRTQGPGLVTAADIEPSADFEIVNPELPLATLDATEARLEVEFYVELGKGYVPATHANGLPIGVIPVDAIFSPIRRVSYAVEPTRIGVDPYDRLLLEVWTDGTITPGAAVSQAARLLVDHFSLLADLGRVMLRAPERQPLSPIAIPPKQYETPVEELELSVRSLNCLRRAGITKVGQVLEMSEDELLNLRNFGRKSLVELREHLEVRGFLVSPRGGGTQSSSGAEGEREREEA